MNNLSQIKKQKEDKVSELINTCSMFFAFSNAQFTENKTPLQEGENYVHLGAGAYMPKGKVDAYLYGIKAINKWYKLAIKENKLRKDNIVYELNNQEAFYTGEIETTVDALGDDYNESEVREVFKSERNNQDLQF